MVLKRIFNRKIIVSLLIIFTLLPAFAQDTGGEPAAIIVYADDEYEIDVLDSDGVPVDAYIGMDLLEGDTIRTYNSTVELQLEPNGSILKLSEATSFKIDGFQRDVNSSNDFSLIAGKIRAVAAKSSTTSYNYNIYTQSTVCGVRGTDFLIGDNGKLVVGEGSVEFIKMDTGESLMVNTGQIADAFADAFQVISLTADQLAQEFQSFDFEKLNPFDVEGHSASPEPVVEEEEEEAEEEEAIEEETTEEEEAEDEGEALESVDDGGEEGEEAGAEDTGEAREPSALEKMLEPIAEMLGMEIGSMTLDGKTYSKLLLQPEFSIGKLQLALYLPIIYETDVFDPNDWYHPAGNNEWSFGTDKIDDGFEDVASDLASDLFLKIKYVKWGEQRDPFYFKLGNVNDMTVGHGILMENYANDADFPAVRKVGLNMGINREKMGVEFVGDDLADLQIVGGRIAFGSKLKFGISGIVDINAEAGSEASYLADGETPDPDAVVNQEPQFFSFGADFDFPLFETDLLSFVFFTDAATMLPIINGQLKTNFILDTQIDGTVADQLRNYGFAGGLLGNILGAQYKVQYMYGVDLFRHGLYNSTYDRTKAAYLSEVETYLGLKDAGTFDTSEWAEPVVSQGVYGTLTWELGKIFDISAGYKWPWDADGFNFEDDYLHFKVTLKPDVIPIVGIHGSLTYDRTNFVGSIRDGEFSLRNPGPNTVLKGELIVPVAPTLDMGATLSSAVERDTDGNVIYDVDGNVNAYYAFTIDTKVHF